MELSVEIWQGEEVAVEFKGRYAVRLQGRDESRPLGFAYNATVS